MGSEVERILAEVRIRELPRRRVSIVTPATPLGEAYRLLDEEHSVALLVCDDGALVGIFTERDVVGRTALEGDPATPIGELMSPLQASLTFDDRLADAIELMHATGYRHIPLSGGEGEEPGLVGGRDILKLIASYFPETLLNLPPRLHQVMTRPEGGVGRVGVDTSAGRRPEMGGSLMRCPHCAADNLPGADACDNCGSNLAGLDLPEAGEGFRGRLLTSRLGDLKITPAVVVTPDETVARAVGRMREARTGCVLVFEDEELVGLFNERDLLTRVVRQDLDLAATPIAEVMTPDPLALAPEDPPAFAIHCMVAYGLRHLPVVSQGRVLGYISVRNILAFLHEHVIASAPSAG